MKKLISGAMRLDDLPDDTVERLTAMLKTDAKALQARFDERQEKERNSPGPASIAPDFNLERIDGKGVRTGAMCALKDNLDKPVALIFGSYT